MIAVAIGLAAGSTQHSAGWGFVAFLLFLALLMSVGIVIQAFRGKLQMTAQIYRRALSKVFSRQP